MIFDNYKKVNTIYLYLFEISYYTLLKGTFESSGTISERLITNGGHYSFSHKNERHKSGKNLILRN